MCHYFSPLSPMQIQCLATSFDQQQEHVVIHLADSSALSTGDRYRFCLVLIEEFTRGHSELVVGCSNLTKLYSNAAPVPTSSPVPLPIPSSSDAVNVYKSAPLPKVISSSGTASTQTRDAAVSTTITNTTNNHTLDLVNKGLLIIIGFAILTVGIVVLLWRITKIKQYIRNAPPCSSGGITRTDMSQMHGLKPNNDCPMTNNSNRYYKLQATTSL